MRRIVLTAYAFCAFQLVLLSAVSVAFATAESPLQPDIDDYLSYEGTWHGNPAEKLNYTFSSYISADVVNVTVRCSNWTALGYSVPPENQGFITINITSGEYLEQSPDYVVLPVLFNWRVEGNHIIVGEQTLDILGEENVTIGITEYCCWRAVPQSTSDVYELIEKTNGIIFEAVSTQTENEWTLRLLEATVDDHVIIPEFPILIIPPLFMAATLSVIRICRRRHST